MPESTDKDSVNQPTWDSSMLALTDFLERLEEWLCRKNQDYLSVVTEGFILYRNITVVPAEFHGCCV